MKQLQKKQSEAEFLKVSMEKMRCGSGKSAEGISGFADLFAAFVAKTIDIVKRIC